MNLPTKYPDTVSIPDSLIWGLIGPAEVSSGWVVDHLMLSSVVLIDLIDVVPVGGFYKTCETRPLGFHASERHGMCSADSFAFLSPYRRG